MVALHCTAAARPRRLLCPRIMHPTWACSHFTRGLHSNGTAALATEALLVVSSAAVDDACEEA